MSKIQWKGGTILCPVPAVLVSCADGEKKNVFTVAWTGIICSNPPRTYVSVRPERYSYDLIKNSGEFCINLPTSYMAKLVDFCGVKSGKEINKFETLNLTPEASTAVSCPSVAECPVTLECKVFEAKDLGSHTMFMADIVAVTVDEKILDARGRMSIEKANLMTYGHGTYYALGKRIGTFGYSVKKKK